MPGPRILIVDDQAVFRRAARGVLECRGYVVVGEADACAPALEAVEQLEPDAVLLDVRLADEDGFEVARTLTDARPALRVLLVSADPVHGSAARVRNSGACGFVPKRELAAADLATFWPTPAL